MLQDKTEKLLHLWFNNIEGIGEKYKTDLIRCFGSLENIFKANEDEVFAIINKRSVVYNFMESKNLKLAQKIYDELGDRKINFTYPGDTLYPQKLYNIYAPPQIIYIKGDLKNIINQYNSCIGVVGARNTDVYGLELSRYFSKKLAESKITIVSGLARGVDSEAHRGAIEAGGYTVAVLGCGINVTYPPENAELYAIIERQGAIISEYGLGIQPSPGRFPVRNRIISGLSDALLVVQAKRKSGSLITADCALEQGKQVYAIPGRALDPNSEGTNNLIKQGAICVTSPEDILLDMNIINNDTECLNNEPEEGYETDKETDKIKNSLAPAEKMLYSCLGLEPLYIDDIIQMSGMGITKVISTLYIMEEKKIIKQPARGYYIIAL